MQVFGKPPPKMNRDQIYKCVRKKCHDDLKVALVGFSAHYEINVSVLLNVLACL
jgi:hypothetical protein